MEVNQGLLKQDVRGRVRTPAERREVLLDEFGRSGLSGPKFAALVGVKYQTFAGWVHDRRKKRPIVPAPAASPLRLVEAVVACEAKERTDMAVCASSVLQVHLAGGVRLEIGDAAQVKLAVSLIKALSGERPC
jgi:hypothetical protein